MKRCVWMLVLVLGLPVSSHAESQSSVGEPAVPRFTAATARPQYGWALDAPLVALGLAGLIVDHNLATETRVVPPEGLPLSDVQFDFDRRAIGENDTGAGATSDNLKILSLTYPFLVRAVFAHSGERIRSPMSVALVYVESLALSEAVTGLLKPLVSRPRPYTYLAEPERPDDAAYDVQDERAFESLPSGHASSAWCAVSTGICDHLLSNPTASWEEHAAIGLVGGLLATATSSLRVEAGQHFPSDIVAGSIIGIASGAAVPLIHSYAANGESALRAPRRSWVAAIAGTATGIGAGLLAAEVLGD